MPHNYPQPASTPLWQTLVGEYYANMKLINDKNAVITPADMATRDYAYNTIGMRNDKERSHHPVQYQYFGRHR